MVLPYEQTRTLQGLCVTWSLRVSHTRNPLDGPFSCCHLQHHFEILYWIYRSRYDGSGYRPAGHKI